MAIFELKTQNIKKPKMCVPAASQDTTLAKKLGENINFEKSYIQKTKFRKWPIFPHFGPILGKITENVPTS